PDRSPGAFVMPGAPTLRARPATIRPPGSAATCPPPRRHPLTGPRRRLSTGPRRHPLRGP
ncbi:prenyltransferase/squalene oxidase repeat-containing protein, partial [Streptomyces sp. NPDC055051]